MIATAESKTASGETSDSEVKPTEQEVSGAASESGKRFTDEEISILTDFITQERDDEVEQTARDKKLAKQRKQAERDLELLLEWGELLNDTDPRCRIKEGGRTYWVAPREFLDRKSVV